MRRRHLASLCSLALVTSGCILPKDQHATVNLGADFATKFVHRGQTLVDNPVLQSALDVEAPTTDGGGVKLGVEANMDVRNDTGAAWFPDGHAGKVTQFEMIGSYKRKVGDFDLEAGIHGYNLPNGLEFPFGERGATTELFVTASVEVLETHPYVSWHYDFDEVNAPYTRMGITEDIPLGGSFELNLDGSLAWATSSQSAWMYGLAESGWADLRGTAEVSYLFDERTVLVFSLNGSTIVDSTLRRWFVNDLGIDADPVWVTLGVVWQL